MESPLHSRFKGLLKRFLIILVTFLFILNLIGSFLERKTLNLQIPLPSMIHVKKVGTSSVKTMIASKSLDFLVNTDSCKIQNFSAYDASLRYIIGKKKLVKCDHFKSFSYVRMNKIYVMWGKLQAFISPKNLSYCMLWPILRPISKQSNHNTWTYGVPYTKFKNFTNLHHDFIRIQCFSSEEKVVYKNFHSCVQEKAFIEQLRNRKYKQRKQKFPDIDDNLNVLLLGTDSVSRLNSKRFLRKTRQYLLNQLSAVEMLGYNKVDDNTFPNLVPILAGKTIEELPWSHAKPVKFDSFPFLWKNYSENGFRTLFLEDSPYGAIFDYLKPGFVQTPTDYYNRHFHLAMEEETDLWYHGSNCFVDKLQSELVLHYTRDFLTKFKGRQYFGFVFLTRATHDYLEMVATVDDVYFRFLQEAKNQGILNNTIVIFFSDHGIRFGSIRKTFLGKIEERLPMMFVSLPEWFRKKYPSAFANLRGNSRKLTSPFDVYETLMHVLYFRNKTLSKPTLKPRGYSWFEPIPQNRSCSDAGISGHWCACAAMEEISTSGNAVQTAARFVLDDIHMKLYSVWDLCVKLNISQINSAYRLKPANDVLEKMYTSYQLTFTVEPGGGMFEATVRWDARNKGYSLEGSVSRINAYGAEKRCNVNNQQEKFCFCKENMSNINKTSHL